MTNGNFPERLRDAIARRRITGRELAAGAGTTEATVSRYLSGARSPENFEILARTAEFLDVAAFYLFGRTNNHFKNGSLPVYVKYLLALYLRASDDDRKVLWAILDKYKAE